jgi:hypothetical protein
MGIIKWGWWKKKEEDQISLAEKLPPDIPIPEGAKPPRVEEQSDIDRVANYLANGGEIVDLSNKPRKDNDGLPLDHELLTPFNRAHTGMKAGIYDMVGRK